MYVFNVIRSFDNHYFISLIITNISFLYDSMSTFDHIHISLWVPNEFMMCACGLDMTFVCVD